MEFVLVLLTTLLAAGMVAGALGAAFVLAPRRRTRLKNQPYECGEATIGPTWIKFNIGYYLFALMFLVFDVEAAFFYPWAVVFRELGVTGLIEMGLFAGILILGLAYAWRKGALEWL